MKRVFATILFTVSTLSAAAAAGPVQLDPYIGGRVVKQTVTDDSFRLFSEPQDQTIYAYQWPGAYFEARFIGGSVDVKVDDDQNNLYLYIDGAHKLTLTRPGRTTVSLKDLGPGAHTVRLEKASETQASIGKFDGFYVPAEENALPAPKYDRRIEFIGDSFTVGYGNTSRGTTCTTDDVRDTTDTSQAFAPITAKHFSAAYRINAYSGRGIVRNYNGIAPGETLPVLYKFSLFDKSVVAPEDGWIPDVIVIGLGTNDFSTPLNPGEAWPTREALRADFTHTYANFVETLHAKYPGAHFILMASDRYENEIANAAMAAGEEARAAGVSDLEVIVFQKLDFTACHGHPSLKDDALLSQILTNRISLLPKFAELK